MGPKSSAVTHAIVPSKDLSWIDRMYLKLENMCVEVDKNPSMLLQETSKYVESHMNVVGANVKKLCTELIQDLMSPPILPSDGSDKLPECAIHCKCNCINADKPKKKGGSMVTKGSNQKTGHGPPSAEEGDKALENTNHQIQDVPTERNMSIESREEEFTKQAQDFNMKGSTLKSEVSGKELDVTPRPEDGKQLTPEDGEELTMSGRQKDLATIVEAHESGTNREHDKQLSLLTKENFGPRGDSIKAHGNIFEHDGRIMQEEKCTSAVVCRGEIDLAKQASRPKADDCQELVAVDEKIAENIKMVAHSRTMAGEDVRTQEIDMLHQAVNVFCGTHPCRPNSISKVCRELHTSHTKMINFVNSLDCKVASLVQTDEKNAQSCGRNMEKELVQNMNEVGGDLQFMYSYVFNELSKSNKEEDPMAMSDFLVEDGFEDEEQSAHWFDGEDVSMVICAHDFCNEKAQQADSCVRDNESDWELV